MDTSAATLLLLFSVNVVFLIVTIISFNIIRRIRGDKAKVKLTKEDIQSGGFSDLEAILLEPTKSKSFTLSAFLSDFSFRNRKS